MNEKLINDSNLHDLAITLRALSHPMRIQIMKLVDKNKMMNVSQIQHILKIEQAAVSHHLNLLKNVKVLKSKRNGKNVEYTMVEGVIERLEKAIELLLKK